MVAGFNGAAVWASFWAKSRTALAPARDFTHHFIQ
jgi:hypothetical protein